MMSNRIPIVVTAIGAATFSALLLARRYFYRHLDSLEAELMKPAPLQPGRTDLPVEVIALATRLGAESGGTPDFVTFKQNGQMWSQPGGKPIAFRAQQIVRLDSPGFVWRAVTDLPMRLVIADYFVENTGGLEVRVLGALPIEHTVGGPAINQGEVLRYLAELPLCPDAILANRALEWKVVNPTTIKVATGTGASRGEITFILGDDGLILTGSAASRSYSSKDGPMTRPWHGRFWDYQRIDGRLIPMQAEVAWTLDEGEFIYWRGLMFDWQRSARQPDCPDTKP